MYLDQSETGTVMSDGLNAPMSGSTPSYNVIKTFVFDLQPLPTSILHFRSQIVAPEYNKG